MQTALESLEKEELIALVKQREQENAYLKSQIELHPLVHRKLRFEISVFIFQLCYPLFTVGLLFLVYKGY